MDMKLLDYHDSRLSPEARWLVMQWSSIIGLDQSTECSLQELFARLGLTYAQGRRAWDVLTDKKGKNQERFVEIERLPCKGPGRPASRYRLSAKLVKALEAKSSLACKHHTEEIKILAKTTRLSSTVKIAGVEERGRSRRSGLPLPNRWLLMVLLAHADAPAIVTCLSVSALRRLTGMSSFRITNQLKKLRDLGLIAHHQPGLYSSEAGARKTSIYIFDLSHPLLGQRGRESVTVSSLPSSVKNKRTELLDGIVDAVMAAGVCSRQIEALLTTPCAIEDAEDDAFNSATENTRQENDSAGLAKAYRKAVDIRRHALDLLPNRRYLDAGLGELLYTYSTDDADMLLASVHSDAMLMLSKFWLELKEGQIGPDHPKPEIIAGAARRLGLKLECESNEHLSDKTEAAAEENPHGPHNEDEKKAVRPTEASPTAREIDYSPLVILFYALSHHLAKKLQRTLQDNPKMNSDIDCEAMSYVLVPVYTEEPDKKQISAYQLRGYGLNIPNKTHRTSNILFRNPVGEDLRTYWRTHHQEIFSGNSDEPDDLSPDSP